MEWGYCAYTYCAVKGTVHIMPSVQRGTVHMNHMEVFMKRNLDGVYFRVKRNDKWENVCFSDLTIIERDEVLKDRNIEWLKSLCCILADTIIEIGTELDIVRR